MTDFKVEIESKETVLNDQLIVLSLLKQNFYEQWFKSGAKLRFFMEKIEEGRGVKIML